MIEIRQAAPLMTVQDLGRTGLRHLGIPQCGAMDPYALSIANWLVGNPANLAGLEIVTVPLSLHFHQSHRIALTGQDYQARCRDSDGHETPLPCGFAHSIPAGSTVVLPATQNQGGRAYLAIAGGVDVPLTLNARSTDLVNRFGGLAGRPLQRDDAIKIGSVTHPKAPVSGQGVRPWQVDGQLRAVPGLDINAFPEESQQAFWYHPWTLSRNLSRTGIKLDGRPLDVPSNPSRLSAGVLPGMIQVPGGEQIILLAADAQTTGGYPCIASVIAADLWKLAYLQPGQTITFVPVSIAEAQGQNSARRRYMQQLAKQLQVEDTLYQ